MKELLDFAFSGINIIPTMLFLFTTIYWIIVILGVIDVDALDLDLDVSSDVDGLTSVLAFFNLDELPLMIFVTFYSLPLWVITLTINDLLGIHSFFWGLPVFLPAAVLCLFISKFLTIPFALFYKKIRNETEAVEDLVGKICVAKLTITSDRRSQAEIRVNGTSVLINAKTRDDHRVEKGQTALVIDFEPSSNTYFVEPYQY